ncbi:MAG: hypothetical protein AAF574_08770 [Pseudomonadota bacterium]
MTLLTIATALLATASPAVVELEAEQRAPTPHSDSDGPLAFHLSIRARCADADDALLVAASLGDTLSDWQPADDGELPPLTLDVPRRQLVLSAPTICARRGVEAPTDSALEAAFTAQVVARCKNSDGETTERSTTAPLTIRFSCNTEPEAEDTEPTE